MAEMNVAMTAARHVLRQHQGPDADDRPDHRGAQERPRAGARPSRCRMSPPRTGIPPPTTRRATMITISGTSSAAPVWGIHE